MQFINDSEREDQFMSQVVSMSTGHVLLPTLFPPPPFCLVSFCMSRLPKLWDS